MRQEKVEKSDKVRFGRIGAAAWPGLRLNGRSDLHCYFWPAATRLLKPGGFFGFLTSSSWLDVEYGFALQGWMLRYFRILAVMESAAEPWFEDARVKTCIAILQRCDDEKERMANPVRFVRFAAKLADLIGIAPGETEGPRQAALEALRSRILGATSDRHDENMRIIVKTQADLWQDGVGAAAVLDSAVATVNEDDADDGECDPSVDDPSGDEPGIFAQDIQPYRAGKWGRYVRAPDIYFEIMHRFGTRFVALGRIASIRFGVKTGCDAFFMPKDVTATLLNAFPTDKVFRQRAGGAPRADVESGKLKIIQAGDGSIHPIESEYLAPEVHSLMKVDRPVIRAADLDRVVLLVNEPMAALKRKAPWVWRYLGYGTTATFTSAKSQGKSPPERATCMGRDPWYDLTGLVKPGFAFWPKSQQYRHISPANPERVICNCNLYDISSEKLSASEQKSLVAVLNSTLVGLFKAFYGRYAGTEGNLKTEVVDVNLLEVPDPRGVSAPIAKRLAGALARMGEREVGRLVEVQLMACHTPDRARRIAAGPLVLSEELQQPDRRDLDDAVLELLGVADALERKALLDRLYEATARHFRAIRVVEIEKMEQRKNAEGRGLNVYDLAADIWDAAELADATPLAEWIGKRPEATAFASIPDERPAAISEDVMFSPNVVAFGKARKTFMECTSRGQAELVARLATFGVTGDVRLPADLHPCFQLLARVDERLAKARERFRELAESRTGDERVRGQLVDTLERWFVLGREPRRRTAPEDAPAEAGRDE